MSPTTFKVKTFPFSRLSVHWLRTSEPVPIWSPTIPVGLHRFDTFLYSSDTPTTQTRPNSRVPRKCPLVNLRDCVVRVTPLTIFRNLSEGSFESTILTSLTPDLSFSVETLSQF